MMGWTGGATSARQAESSIPNKRAAATKPAGFRFKLCICLSPEIPVNFAILLIPLDYRHQRFSLLAETAAAYGQISCQAGPAGREVVGRRHPELQDLGITGSQ